MSETLENQPFVLIDDLAKDGAAQLVRRGASYAVAHWARGGWVLGRPEWKQWQPLSFRPEEYRRA